MVKLLTLFSTLAGMSAVMCAPTNSVTIVVKNNCKSPIQLNQLTNEQAYGTTSDLAAGSSTTLHVEPTWGGRIWAREDCSGDTDCHYGAPASLAEFLMGGAMGKDFYDVSFVDGYNLPISISTHTGEEDGYECGAPACVALPDCPEELRSTNSDGDVVGCKSACSHFGTDEYCCTGEFGRGVCDANKYSSQVKEICPNVYTYPNDDTTSMYACQATGYTVTFCPA
ncbi:thaumatin [Pilaira anomala]|nr:thaumatin [Pilaira anomala]